MSLVDRLERFRAEEERLAWEGSFLEYFNIVTSRPEVSQLSHARIYNMIMNAGVETTDKGRKLHKFFAKDIFGLDKTLDQLVEYFNSAAKRLEVRKRILLLMGPVGGGKSSIVALLKRGLERYSRSDEGALYAIKGCPMHEEPLHLIPESLRDDIRKEYGLYIEGDLCPSCRQMLKDKYGGRIEDVRIQRITFSEKNRIGIGTFTPSDPKSQDISELTGSVDLATIGEFGSESDPRAYRFDGELNIANRGLMEFIEMLKCVSPSTLLPTGDGLLTIGELAELYCGNQVGTSAGAPPGVKAAKQTMWGTPLNFSMSLRVQTANRVEEMSHLIYNGIAPTIRLTTCKGYSLEGALDHRVLVLDADGEHRWKPLDQIKAGETVCLVRGGPWVERAPQLRLTVENAPQISLVGSETPEPAEPPLKVQGHRADIDRGRSARELSLPEVMDEDVARFLGYFVAEGDFLYKDTGIRITSADSFVIDDVRSIGEQFGLNPRSYGPHHHICSVELARWMRSLGFQGNDAGNKMIPLIVRRSPKRLVAAFLRAYFDGDGTVTNLVSCTTKSRTLAVQIQAVLLNFGIVAKLATVWNREYEREYYSVQIDSDSIGLFRDEIGFGVTRKRGALTTLALEPARAHRDGLPNMTGQWQELLDELKVAATRISAAEGHGYRDRRGVRQLVGDRTYEDLWRFARGSAQPSFTSARRTIETARALGAAIPKSLEEALASRYFYDSVVAIEKGESELWDLCVPANHSYLGNGFVNHNCDEKFLYGLLTLSQEQSIKTGRFSMIYADEVIVSHTNENEYNAFVSNKKNEALKDRIILVKVPYNLRVSDEVKIYEKLLAESGVKGIHIAPHTLRVASIFAVLSRLEPSKKAGLSLMKKLKLYDGEEVEGFTTRDVKELQEESDREGMIGISPRYIINRLSSALVKENVTCINPLDALRALKDGLEQHTGITRDEKEQYLNFIYEARKEYDEIAKTEIQKAFVYSFEESARTLFNNYLDNVEAFCNKDKIKDPITEEEMDPDEKLMRSIEEQIGVTENAKKAFREEILIRMSSLARRGQKFEYTSHERLKEAIEKKLFADLKNVVKITTSTKTPDAEQLKRINEVADRLVKEHGYCTVCANELLKYVGTLLSR